MLNSFAICLVIYPFPAHWAWNPDGWLALEGFLDLAGSGVVHLVPLQNMEAFTLSFVRSSMAGLSHPR